MPDRSRPHLVALTVAFLASGTAFALGAPLFQAPDEPQHVDMVRHYAHHPADIPGPELRIRNGVQQAVAAVGLPQGGPIPWPPTTRPRPAYPRFSEFRDADGPARGCVVNIEGGAGRTCQNYHYGHPPTFYLVAAAPARALEAAGFPIQVLVLRLLCVAVTAPVVLLTYRAARHLWPESAGRALAAATAVAGFAPLAANAAAVNNHYVTVVLAAAAIAAAARYLQHPDRRGAVLLGAAIGAGLLVKSPFIALAAASSALVLVGGGAVPGRERFVVFGCFAGPVALGSAWWTANLVRFGTLGQPGTEILQSTRPGPWNDANPLRYAVDHVDELVNRFWGLYGQTAVEVPQEWRTSLTVAAATLLVGWVVGRGWHRPSAAGLRVGLLSLLPLALAAGAIWASFDVYRDNGEVRGLLGRYLYPGVPVLALGAVATLAVVTRPLRRFLSSGAALAAGTVAVAFLTAASFVRAMHGFYGTRHTGRLLERAATVTALPRPGPWIAIVAAVWASSTAAAVWLALRLPPRSDAANSP